ncbi:MAG: ATP-dependent DNA ligase [Actinobacteria bacterium]|nr:ATP-dependent DNA ligase [Actinomycetota bacterium]
MAPQLAEDRIVTVERRTLVLKHLDKVHYPETSTTKAAVIDYYARIAPAMLPHLADRAVTLKRYPDGVEGESFFEKQCPSHRPAWMKTAPRFAPSSGRTVEYCVIDDTASLVWLANIATLEFHVPLARRRSMQRARSMVFDLDPGPGADVIDCAEVALSLRERLAIDGLESLIKTSGSKGLQLYVPLNVPRLTFDRTKDYARAIAHELAARYSNMIVANMRRSLRDGRVLIDWSQNDDAKTTVCAYSLRGRRRPTVSTPLEWGEVERAQADDDAESLVFDFADVLDRVDRLGDLFARVNEQRQQLPRQ